MNDVILDAKLEACEEELDSGTSGASGSYCEYWVPKFPTLKKALAKRAGEIRFYRLARRIVKIEIRLLVLRVAHQRKRTGIANPDSVGYVRFNYKCKPTCVRCALEKALA